MVPPQPTSAVTGNNAALCTVQRMRPDYKEHYRATAVGYILSFAARLSIVDDYAHDAVLLMDRAMSTCMQVRHPSPCSACCLQCSGMALLPNSSQILCVRCARRCRGWQGLG